MTSRLILTGLLAAIATTPAMGVSGGKIGTLERGYYSCERPGDIATEYAEPVPEEDFEIIGASRYQTSEGRGIYLRTGDLVQMTSGPKNGTHYSLKNSKFLRRLDSSGEPDELRCVRRGSGYQSDLTLPEHR
jgi:hypothetical protein